MGKVIDFGSKGKNFKVIVEIDNSSNHYEKKRAVAIMVDKYGNTEIFYLINNFLYIYSNGNRFNTQRRRMAAL
jgi:hypothetical protein